MNGLARHRYLYLGMVLPVIASLLMSPLLGPLGQARAAGPAQVGLAAPSSETRPAPAPVDFLISPPDSAVSNPALTSAEPPALTAASLSALGSLWEKVTVAFQAAQPAATQPTLTPLETKTVVLQADKEASLQSTDGKIKMVFPVGTVAEDVRVELKVHRPGGSTGTKMVNLFEVNGYAVNRQDAAVTSLLKPVQVTIANAEGELAGLDTSSLALYYLEEKTRTWQPVAAKYDPKTRTLAAATDHFTYYGEQANPAISGPGQVLAFQVDLHSGAAVSRYPLELPPGPGGFQPKLELVYNSGVADEMKNKRSLGSWVGIGWSLHPGRISYDESTGSYNLEVGGVSYTIVYSNGKYYTLPDAFYKITRTGQTWEVYDREGVYYRFGGTTDSEQYYSDNGTHYYRWELSLLRDTHSNEMVVVYQRDIWGGSVRSAYPQYLRYNSNLVEVQFSSVFDESDADGNLRADNPKSYGTNPAPKVMENKKLTTIDVKAGNPLALVRKYTFAYNTTARVWEPSQYGGIWYSGKHKLTSITQVGADGTSSLPATALTYTDLTTHLKDSGNPTYSGNPGNPADFSWPHLTQVNNGYGATVSFAYTQTPPSTRDDMWTREVVTTRTVAPGIGPDQTSTYTYAGDPEYVGSLWEAEFRGFGSVQEKDTPGNFTWHYFYTAGKVNNQDADKLTGKEYKTRWYDSSNNLLKETVYTWEAAATQNDYAFVTLWDGFWKPGPKFNNPRGVAIDSNGYVYVADTGNHRIQKFTSSGDVVASWGSQGNGNGQFQSPYGVASDGTYVYVADTGNNRVRRYDRFGSEDPDFNISGLSGPSDVATDATHIYVSDTTNHKIQKFTSSGTLAGSWDVLTQYGAPGSPRGLSVAGGYVYVAVEETSIIRKYDTSGGGNTWWDASAVGSLSSPWGVEADGTYVYVADTGNNRIVTFETSGTVVRVWGNNEGEGPQFMVPYGVAVSGGYAYIADKDHSRILKYDSLYVFQNSWGSFPSSSGRFNGPLGMGARGRYVYSADSGNSRIQMFDSYGNFVTNWATGASDIDPDGTAYVYVSDNGVRVRKYEKLGQFVSEWGDGLLNTVRSVATDGNYVYASDYGNARVRKFNTTGGLLFSIAVSPWGVATDGTWLYVADYYNHIVRKYNAATGTQDSSWGGYGSGDGLFIDPRDLALDSNGNVYVVDQGNNRVQKFTSSGVFLTKWGSSGTGHGRFSSPSGVSVDGNEDVYVTDSNNRIQKFARIWTVRLAQVDDITYGTGGSKTSRVSYFYDTYGNITKVENRGDTGTATDDSTVYRTYYPNTTAWILSKPGRERAYPGIKASDDGTDRKKESFFYYDGATVYTAPPTKGDLTRLQQSINATDFINTNYGYDTYGNQTAVTDPRGKTTTYAYDTTYHTYLVTKTYPAVGGAPAMSESYTWDTGAGKLLSETDVNGQTTSYEYDTFKRLTKGIRPGDSSASPTIEHQYVSWGTINQQHVKTIVKDGTGDGLQRRLYFDGLGRQVQLQAEGETGRTIVTTTTFSNRGLVDKEYVPQDLDSATLSGYKAPEAAWKSTAYAYDALARAIAITKPDATTLAHDYSIPRQDTTTDERGLKKRYSYDAFARLAKVEELNDSEALYATTIYTYDALGSLTQVVDAASNTTTMAYDWLSRKTSMTDPDMGAWSYAYDGNGNLAAQTDAKSQTITFAYDELNRFTGKTYPAGSGMTNVSYGYDSTTGGNYGKGRRTSMADAAGTASYTYDTRGRLTREDRGIDGVTYTTQFAYDAADRQTSVTYPTGEVATQTYTPRGLPSGLSSDVSGSLVSSSLYNQLGQPTELNLGNSTRMTFGYWGLGGTYDNPGGYYGKLWELKTIKDPGGTPTNLQQARHTWDAGGNLAQRTDVLAAETETFAYDFLDRLTGVSGAYSEGYTYNTIGNILTKGGLSYTYGSRPHAVTAVGSKSYAYDGNGNMTARDAQALTWDVENRPTAVTQGGQTISRFVYDGDGNRVKKTEGGQATIYANKYYSKDLPTLAGMWHLDENTGTTAADASGYGNTGTLTGPTWAAGKYGSALSFDGTDDYLEVPDSATLDITSAVTVEAWVKPAALTDNATIAQKGSGGERNYDLHLMSTGKVRWHAMTGGQSQFLVTSTATLSAGTWYHVVGTFDGATARLYLDGVLDASAAYSGTLAANSLALFVGGDTAYSNHYFNGAIDEVAVWGRTLSADEVMGRYLAGGRVALWHLDEGAGTAADDASAYGNHGALKPASGGPAWVDGKVGKALSFDGSNDYVEVPHSASLQPSAITIEFWLKAPQQQNKYFLQKGTTAAATYEIGASNENPARLQFNAWSGGGTTISQFSDAYVFDNAWHQVAVTYDGARLKWYIDGVLNKDSAETGAMPATSASLLLGKDTIRSAYFNGMLDEVSLWGRVLDANEVRNRYLAADLAAQWHLDEGSGVYAAEGSGKADFGTLAGGPTWTAGKYGKALSFDGSDDYVDIPHSASLQPGAITIEFWLKAPQQQNKYFLQKGTTAAATYEVGASNENPARLQFNAWSGGGTTISQFSDAYVFDNGWHQVAVTYDGARLKWYIDGVLNKDSAETGAMPATSASLLLGKDTIRSAYFNGTLDEVNIYSRALSAGEVSARYNAASSLRSNVGVALGGSRATLSYYLGGRLVAQKKGSDLQWISQDHLTGTALVTDSSGNSIGSTKFYPFGATRSGSVPIDRKFTGQRLDSSGLYYYGARYYDAEIGRFISADTLVPQPANPQAFNRYSYVLNNPLKYVDPTGHQVYPSEQVPATIAGLLAAEQKAAREGIDVSFIINDKQGTATANYWSELEATADALRQVEEEAVEAGVGVSFVTRGNRAYATYGPAPPKPSAPGGGIQTGVGTGQSVVSSEKIPTPLSSSRTTLQGGQSQLDILDVTNLVVGTSLMIGGAMLMTFGFVGMVSAAALLVFEPWLFPVAAVMAYSSFQAMYRGYRAIEVGLGTLRKVNKE